MRFGAPQESVPQRRGMRWRDDVSGDHNATLDELGACRRASLRSLGHRIGIIRLEANRDVGKT
jgi:hypothetical protein